LALVSLFLVSARVVKQNEVEDIFRNEITNQNAEAEEFVEEEDEEIVEEEEEEEEEEEAQEEEEEEEEEKWIELQDESGDFDVSQLRPVSFANEDLSEQSEEAVYKGEKAELGMFPYVVYVMVNKRYFCTGILYNKKTVLTAAHCVDPKFYNLPKADPDSIIVRAGSIYRTQGGQSTTVDKFKTHPDFDPQTFAFDIAVLTLKESFELSEDTYTEAAKFSDKKLKAKDSLWLAGYGLMEAQDRQEGYPLSLLYGELEWQQPQVCAKAYQRTSRKIDPKSEFCAGVKPMSGCRGDSGGPLITADSAKEATTGKAQVVGMLIYGVNCGGPNIFLSLKGNKSVWKFIQKNA
jgi:trypsin